MNLQMSTNTHRWFYWAARNAQRSLYALIWAHLWLHVALITILVLSGNARAGQPSELLGVYRGGERLVYDVTWLGIKAGQATLESLGVIQLNGERVYHLVTTANSTPQLSKIFRVDDRTESFLALDPMRALRFEKHLREGRYRHSSRTEFDHEKGIATFRYLDFSKVPREITRVEEAERHGKYLSQEFPLNPGALDELSVLYYVRTLPLAAGTTVMARVFAGKKNWDLEVRVLGRETLQTVLGPRSTVVMEPLLKFEGIFQRKGRMIVWITDDAERVPVLMKSEVKIGSFVATLTRREIGLPHARLVAPGGPAR